jgi:quercetin dioxygenase-like cupin family protein
MMDNNIFRSLADIAVKETIPGFYSRFIHTENNTINFIEIKAGCSVPLHQHVHEQSSFVLEGRFEMTVGDEVRVLEPGLFCIVAPNLIHGGTAITDCKLIDVFSPVREDYRNI